MRDKTRLLIAWWQMITGALGFLAYGISAVTAAGRDWMMNVVGPTTLVLGAVFFAAVIIAGYGLKERSRWGISASVLCQVIQIVSFAFLGGPHFIASAGPLLGVLVNPNQFTLKFGFESTFFVGTRVQGPPWEFRLNVVPMFWAIALLRETSRRRDLVPTGAI